MGAFYSAAVESVPFDIVFRYACAKRYSEKKDCFFRNLRFASNKQRSYAAAKRGGGCVLHAANERVLSSHTKTAGAKNLF